MKLPIWFAYAIERLPLISSFYEIEYGAGAFIQFRRNHDGEASKKDIAKSIVGTLLHDILNPLRLVDATIRTAFNVMSLVLAPLYAVEKFIKKAGWAWVAFFPLTAPLWFLDRALPGFVQLWIGRQNAGLPYQKLKWFTDDGLNMAKRDNIHFFNALPSIETGKGITGGLPSWIWKKMTTAIYGGLGVKPGRLEHLQNQDPYPLAEVLLAKATKEIEQSKTSSAQKVADKNKATVAANEGIELRGEYKDNDTPNPSLVYGLADIPYQIGAALSRTKMTCSKPKPSHANAYASFADDAYELSSSRGRGRAGCEL